MTHRHAFEVVSRTLQDIVKYNLPFGGKLMVFGDDFFQLLPVEHSAWRSSNHHSSHLQNIFYMVKNESDEAK